MRIPVILLLALFTFVACQSDKTAEKKVNEPKPTAMAKDKYTLTPFSPSPEFQGAKIDAMTYKEGTFNFDISGDYELGAQTADAATKMCANSGKGQHIHLIVDKSPYAAKYVSSFDHEVADGTHNVLAFLSRSYHESIKSSGASMAIKAEVAKGSITSSEPITTPTLFYSRPKGTYVGKANTDKVMLDFFLANVTLANGYTVKASINGEDHSIDKWQPYYIEGMPIGENTIESNVYFERRSCGVNYKIMQFQEENNLPHGNLDLETMAALGIQG